MSPTASGMPGKGAPKTAAEIEAGRRAWISAGSQNAQAKRNAAAAAGQRVHYRLLAAEKAASTRKSAPCAEQNERVGTCASCAPTAGQRFVCATPDAIQPIVSLCRAHR